jgi:hypothetical protein
VKTKDALVDLVPSCRRHKEHAHTYIQPYKDISTSDKFSVTTRALTDALMLDNDLFTTAVWKWFE